MLKEGTLNLESAAKSNKLDVAYIERDCALPERYWL